jgi:predicted lipoprotein with Yx(FWY)xxD motif
MTHLPRDVMTGLRAGAAVFAAGVLVAACSSSGGAGATASTPASAPASGSVTIEAHSGPLGTFLTDSSGKSLYMFASDTSTKSSCTGQCLTYWPPLDGAAKAGSGITGSKLGTINAGGAKQITYGGHPLYYYAGDSKAGDTSGQGSNNFGAKWWLLAPTGKPITAASSGAGGGGYGS